MIDYSDCIVQTVHTGQTEQQQQPAATTENLSEDIIALKFAFEVIECWLVAGLVWVRSTKNIHQPIQPVLLLLPSINVCPTAKFTEEYLTKEYIKH